MAAATFATSSTAIKMPLSTSSARFSGVRIVPAVVPLRTSAPTRSLKVQAKQLKGPIGVDDKATKANPLVPAFTRRREIFAGRLAMTGFSAAVVGELLTGKGPIGQLGLETNLPAGVVQYFIYGLVALNFFAALSPLSKTFDEDNQKDVYKRPRGPTQDPTIYPGDPKKFFGVTNFGFTKKNELFVGRVAMLGFASALIGEKYTGGKGPLGQIGFAIDQPVNTGVSTTALAVWIGFFLFAAVGYSNFGQTDGDEEIY